MSGFNFDFNFVKAGAPIVTLSTLGIAFNALSRSMLGNPGRINIGYDENAHAIGIQPHEEGSKLPNFEFETREKNGWVRIGCKDFIAYISIQTGIDFREKTRQFVADYNKEEGKLVVIVDEEHMK